MGPKQRIQAEANAENTSGAHDVGRRAAAPHPKVAGGGGGLRLVARATAGAVPLRVPMHIAAAGKAG